MPRGTWSKKDERQYRAILRSCRQGNRTCKRIAAATVNKVRAQRLGGLSDLGRPPEIHAAAVKGLLSKLQLSPVTSCRDAVRSAGIAERARENARTSGITRLHVKATDALRQAHAEVSNMCRERDGRALPAWFSADLDGLLGLGAVEPLETHGFKDGKKSWIDVKPKFGPRMRITHEVLGLTGFDAALPPPIPPEARRKCIAWQYKNGARRCAIYDNESEPPLVRARPRPLAGIFGG